MKALNLYILCKAKNNDNIVLYEQTLSNRTEKLHIKNAELDTLNSLVDKLLVDKIEIDAVSGFFYSYTIPQIGKEFDLLKFDKAEGILNIELKSQMIDESKIKDQLLKNKYYLAAINTKVKLYTYVCGQDMLYELTDKDELVSVDFNELIKVNNGMKNYCISGIERLFRTTNYLISPLNTPEKFLNDCYFLTQNQMEIKKKIIEKIDDGYTMFGITGSAGTGKTLVLYDIAKTLSENYKVCVIHCGIECEGHQYLNRHNDNITVVEVKKAEEWFIEKYDYIIVDETQRIYSKNLNIILDCVLKNSQKVIFAYDYFQVLSETEKQRNIPEKLRQKKDFLEFKLSDKIRMNKNMTSFIKCMLNYTDVPKKRMNYSMIEILYAEDTIDAKRIIKYYKEKMKYVFINYTSSIHLSTIDEFGDELNTHHVIGQEFDNVIIYMDENFRYLESGELQAKTHPNPDYMYYKLLYQAVSRCREKLCVVVIGNTPLFEKLLDIKDIGCLIEDELLYMGN